jgi:hypothetical protein
MSQTRRPAIDRKALQQRINRIATERSRAANHVEKAAVVARVRQAIPEGADVAAVLFELERESLVAYTRSIVEPFRSKAPPKA